MSTTPSRRTPHLPPGTHPGSAVEAIRRAQRLTRSEAHPSLNTATEHQVFPRPSCTHVEAMSYRVDFVPAEDADV